MKVRFDSLDRFEVPKFYVCSPGSQYQSGILTKVLGGLSDTSDEELVLNFNAMSELNFRINKLRRSDPDEDAYVTMLYNALQNRRLIFVEDIGYFSISDVKNNYDNGIHYKDVQANSIEIEIQNKLVPYIEDGTYKFMDLMEKIVAVLPLWKIGTVNGDVAAKYRTFEGVSTELNALAFMQENMQDAYLHIKYSNDGTTFTENNGNTVGAFIGTLVDTNEVPDPDPGKYTWKKFTEDVDEELRELQISIDSNKTSTSNLSLLIQNDLAFIKAELERQAANNVNGSDLDERIASAKREIEDAYNTAISNVEKMLNDYKAEVGQYMVHNSDGLTLGASGSDLKTVITNDSIRFMDGDVAVSYIEKSQINFPSAVFNNNFFIGDYIFIVRGDSNGRDGFSIVWRGDEN